MSVLDTVSKEVVMPKWSHQKKVKLLVVLEAFQSDKNISHVDREFEVHPNVVNKLDSEGFTDYLLEV